MARAARERQGIVANNVRAEPDFLPNPLLPETRSEMAVPIIAGDLGSLNTATFVQPFHDVAAGWFSELEEIPRTGMLYLDHPTTGPKIHLTWGQHLQPDPPVASQAWFDPNLDAPAMQAAEAKVLSACARHGRRSSAAARPRRATGSSCAS